jgi:hypothetical protein
LWKVQAFHKGLPISEAKQIQLSADFWELKSRKGEHSQIFNGQKFEQNWMGLLYQVATTPKGEQVMMGT